MSSDATNLALVGVVSTVIVSLFKLLADNTKALGQLVDSNKEIAQEARTGNAEAKQRNGHLGEQNIQIAQLITNQGLDINAIKISNQENAETNERVEGLLRDSAATLVETESGKAIAVAAVQVSLDGSSQHKEL